MHSITLSNDGRYVEAIVTGLINRRYAIQLALDMHAVGHQHDIHRYLIDATQAPNVEPPSVNFIFANETMQTTRGIDHRAVTALLVAPDDHSHDFFETTVRNTGRLIRLFRDREQAIAYLMSQ